MDGEKLDERTITGLFFRQAARFGDRTLVRCSRLIDPLIGRRAGKSVLAVWRNA